MEDFFSFDSEESQQAQSTHTTLIDTQERLGVLLDLMPAGMLIHQAQGILYANREAASMLGDLPERLIGRHVLDYLAGEAVARIDLLFPELFVKDQPIREDEVLVTNPLGKQFVVRFIASRLPWPGLPVVQILLHDITELVQARATLIEAEKMSALGGLVAGIAHEINTPIGIAVTAASGFQDRSQQMIDNLKSGRLSRAGLESYAKSAQETSDIILNNLNRASKLIGSVKQIAVDETCEQPRDFVLSDYLSQLALSLGPEMKRRQVKMSITAPDVLLSGYPGSLAQILTNITMNAAIHAFEPASDANIEIEAKLAKEQVVLTVSDNGRGMDNATLSRIFEPFFTTKRGQGGSGLGLHIVYNLVRNRLGGWIKCHSTLNAGTIFTLGFPQKMPG